MNTDQGDGQARKPASAPQSQNNGAPRPPFNRNAGGAGARPPFRSSGPRPAGSRPFVRTPEPASTGPAIAEAEGTFIVIGRGGGVVKCVDYPDGIRIYESDVNTALHGDDVKVDVLGKKDIRVWKSNVTKTGSVAPTQEVYGRVTEVLTRAKTDFTGTLVEENGGYVLKASDPKLYTQIQIPKDALNGAVTGDRIYVHMNEWIDVKVKPTGSVTKVLGKPGDNETEMQAIALERGFMEAFPTDVLKEAQDIDARGITEDDIKGRRDFRKIVTFTIDPFDAKDFDDAISVEKLANGDTEIGIHIADVSHYVQIGTALDTEALKRGNSVYLVDRTIPMLPHVLSNDLCSLVPNQDRLTMSCVITFSPDGAEKSAWYGPTVIHSAHRYTYENAQEVLDGADHTYRDELMTAAAIARRLGKERMANGALVLEQEEVKIILDADGKVAQIIKKDRTESHTLIEELMLLANRRVAAFLENGGHDVAHTKDSKPKKYDPESGYSVLYRIHDQPSVEKASDLEFFMRSIGHPLKLRTDGTIDPAALGDTLKKFEDGDLKQTALTFVVRSMSKAIYSTKNVGHYGLQFDEYAHFTSPIRRYPDLVIHRLMRMALAGHPAPASARKAYERIARLCSMTEVKAAEAERESVKLKLTEYMSLHVGETITGVITGLAEWGIYVKDKVTTAEGLIGLRTLADEPYTLNPKLATLTGETSRKTYRIGDTIQVRIVRADPERRQIDYEVA